MNPAAPVMRILGIARGWFAKTVMDKMMYIDSSWRVYKDVTFRAIRMKLLMFGKVTPRDGKKG